MKYTMILQLPNGKYHVGVSSDPETYLDKKNKHDGFWSWNRGRCKVIKLYKGDFRQKIKAFGVSKFLTIIESEANMEHFLLELVC